MAYEPFSPEMLQKIGPLGLALAAVVVLWREWRETRRQLREEMQARIADKEQHAARLAAVGTESLRGIGKAADANREALRAVKIAQNGSSQG